MQRLDPSGLQWSYGLLDIDAAEALTASLFQILCLCDFARGKRECMDSLLSQLTRLLDG